MTDTLFTLSVSTGPRDRSMEVVVPWGLGGNRVLETPPYIGPLGYDKHPNLPPLVPHNDLLFRAGWK